MKKGIMLLCILFSCFTMASAEELIPSVTVQGTGSVTITPDLGTISFAVTEDGQKADEVQNTIIEKADTVKEALYEGGLAEDQFSMAGVQLYTQYDYSEGVEKAVGYRGQISMTVKEIDISDVGKYLQILSVNGVNQIEGISVSYSRYEEAYCEALGKAMAQARTKAETMAAMEDATVTGHFTVMEGYQDDSLRGMSKSFAGNYSMSEYEEAAMDVAGGFEYSVGPTEVKATVTVCYMIDTRLE